MKKKKSVKFILLTLLATFLCLVGGGGFNLLNTATASAATTKSYSLTFDYSGSYAAYGMNQPATISDSNITSYTFGTYTVRTISLKLYGTSYSGTATASKGQYFNFSSLNIIADVPTGNSGTTSYITSCRLTNSSGTAIVNNTAASNQSLSTTLYSGTLADDSYTLSVSWSVTDYMPSYPNMTSKSANVTLTTSFKIDTKPPTLNGTSSSQTGKYTNAAFTVSATDTGSGVNAIYMKAPNASSFTNVGTSKTVSSGSTNGLYTFYAVDNQSNTSSYGYVYYDNQKATGTVKTASGKTLSSSSYTNEAFSYTATDSGSGVSYVQYMKPNSSSWESYTSGTQISASATNGKYQFRAVDKANNVSDVTSITLDTVKGIGTLYADDDVEESGSVVKANSVKFIANDLCSGVGTIYVVKNGTTSEYVNGSEVMVEGVISFYFYDRANNLSDTYKITRDTTAPTLTCDDGDWGSTLTDGFTIRASDTYSAVRIFYKIPGESSYKVGLTPVSISVTNPDGKYYVYAMDGCGNISETVWVELSVPPPTYTLIKDTPNNKLKFTWTKSNYYATLNGGDYTKDTWITAEGSYTYILTDAITFRTTTYKFSISHYYVEDTFIVPLCEERGYTVYKCVTCGLTYNDDYIAALGHTDYVKQVIEPTCIDVGYTIYDCMLCNDHEYFADTALPLGHSDYVKLLISPTCTKDGYSIYDCRRCENNEYISNMVDALGHDYAIDVIAPTCVLQGYSIYSCLRCESRYTDDIVAAHGHNYGDEIINPTCVEKGYTLHTCLICLDYYMTDYVLALGHNYTEVTIAPTCVEIGGLKHICVVCEYNYITEREEPTGHSYSSRVTRESNCDRQGERTHTCDKCGVEFKTTIPCLEHDYMLTEVEENGSLFRCYECSICGYTYKEDKGNQYEMVTSYIEHLYKEYSPYMIWVFLSTAGVWSIVMGVSFIIAYRNEDKIKAKKMLKNYLIGLVVIFGILVAMPYLVNGIAYLITH